MIRVLLLLSIALIAVGCEDEHNGKRLLLEWEDRDAATTFRVTESPGAIFKQNGRLHVERDGQETTVLIDDDALFSTIAFVRYDDWLLVVCRGVDEVWAGYDYKTDSLYGEYDWDALPFTRWSGEGDVVAERKVRNESGSPANFPRTDASAATEPSDARP